MFHFVLSGTDERGPALSIMKCWQLCLQHTCWIWPRLKSALHPSCPKPLSSPAWITVIASLPMFPMLALTSHLILPPALQPEGSCQNKSHIKLFFNSNTPSQIYHCLTWSKSQILAESSKAGILAHSVSRAHPLRHSFHKALNFEAGLQFVILSTFPTIDLYHPVAGLPRWR